MKVCVILPIKHTSTRVPGKNYRNFNGEPLMKIVINTILSSKLITTLIIDTNSELVKEILTSNYTDNRIQVYNRPKHLWTGDTPTNVLLENVISALDLTHDMLIQTHVTNPLLTVNTIEACINDFIKKEIIYKKDNNKNDNNKNDNLINNHYLELSIDNTEDYFLDTNNDNKSKNKNIWLEKKEKKKIIDKKNTENSDISESEILFDNN